jgi:UDP-N-acetylglucosamine acyltransferase
VQVHPTAAVDAGARLAEGVVVGPYAVVERGAVVGPRSEIRAHAVVKRCTTLGADNVVHEGAVLGGEPQDVGFSGADSSLVIGDGNRIREGVTIHRASTPGGATRVGSGCFLMASSHVAHDCQVGDGVVMANNVALAGHVHVGDRAFLSGGVVVHQFCRVGRLAMLGGNAKVVRDCLPFVVTDGVPARARGLNVVGLRRAGLAAADVRVLKECYRLLLRSGKRLQEALAGLDQLGHPLAAELAAFVRASRRGITRGTRGADTAGD